MLNIHKLNLQVNVPLPICLGKDVEALQKESSTFEFRAASKGEKYVKRHKISVAEDQLAWSGNGSW